MGTMGVEVCFLVYLFSIAVGCSYGLITLCFAIYQFMVGLVVFDVMCYQRQSRLFQVIRSTWSKYQLQFVELCVHIHILCASLSILGKYRANNYVSDISIVLSQPRTLSTLHKLDVTATLSILVAHLAGHHDVSYRIRRRLIFYGRALHKRLQWLGELFYQMLEEPPSDQEDRSSQRPELVEEPRKTCNIPFSVTQCQKQGVPVSNETVTQTRDVEAVNKISDDEAKRGLAPIRRVPSTYAYVQEELRAIGARYRWSSVRYAFGFQQSPLEGISVLVEVQGQPFPPDSGFERFGNSHPVLQLPPRDRMTHRSSTSFTSSVMDMIEHNNALGIEHVQSDELGGPVLLTTNLNDAELPPCMQLPGEIQSTSIKALPDTGSSQNIIDAVFVRSLKPQVTVQPLNPTSDHPLVAPDGEKIPCIGKVYLPWAFKDEKRMYELCFYVVENCSHQVIIGNGFLRKTETFEKHQGRLEITKRCDPDCFPGNAVSAQEVVPYRRQIVSGTVDRRSVNASLDTGCEANLMSEDYAHEHKLKPEPVGNQEVRFANGRKRSTLGQVEVSWSFADSPDLSVKVKCYVLPGCIHSIILGVHFVISESPWQKHKSTLHWEELPYTGDAGVVALKRGWSLLGKCKPGEPGEAGSFRYFD